MKKIIALLCAGLPLGLFGQYHDEVHEKYWNYRERLVKDFVRVGSANGMSIPMSARSVGFAYANCDVNDEGFKPSRIYYQDATIYLGHYMVMLASEAKILNEELLATSSSTYSQELNRKLEATFAELYFALHALDRLDRRCEGYHYQTGVESVENGLFLRDDVEPDFHTFNYSDDYSVQFNRGLYPTRTHSDNNPVQVWEFGGPTQEFNASNVMSLDQVTTILTGLFSIYKMCPDVNVNFDADIGSMELKEKARQSAIRIINYIVRPNLECGSDCWSFNIVVPEVIFRPAGYDCSFVAPMMIKLAKEFGHPYWAQRWSMNNLDELRIAIQVHPQVFMDLSESISNLGPSVFQNMVEGLAQPCANALEDFATENIDNNTPITIGYFEFGPLVGLINSLNNQQVELNVGGNPCYIMGSSANQFINSFHLDVAGMQGCFSNVLEALVNHVGMSVLNLGSFGLSVFNAMQGEEEIICASDISGVQDILNDDNIHIISEWLAISNFLPSQYINKIAGAPSSSMHWYTLLHAALYQGQVGITEMDTSFLFEKYLHSAPCLGPWDDPLNVNLPTQNTIAGWRAANRLFHPSDAEIGIPDPSFRGEFSGIDFMVYHNLFYLNYPQFTGAIVNEGNCNCKANFFQTNIFDGYAEINPKFPDYIRYNLQTANYITEPMTFQSQYASVDIKSDLELCSGGEEMLVTITDGAKWRVFGNRTIRINEGVTLLVEENAKIESGFLYPSFYDLGNAGRIVVGTGATLYVRNGASIESILGLKIEVEEGGIVIFDNALLKFGEASFGARVKLHENAYFEMKNQSVLENFSNLPVPWIALPNASFVFKNSSVELNNGGFSLEHATVFAENSTIFNSNGSFESRESTLNLLNSQFISENTNWNFYNDCHLVLENAELRLNDSRFRLAAEHIQNALYDGTASEITLTNSIVRLIGEQSEFIVNNVQWTLSPQSYSEVLATGGVGGRIIVEENGVLSLYLANQASLKAVGTNKFNEFILLQENAVFDVQGPQGQFACHDGRITFSQNADFISNARFVLDKCHAATNNSGFGGKIKLIQPNVSIRYSDFNKVSIDALTSHLKINACNFIDAESGILLRGGSFNVVASNFQRCGLESSKLESVSTISHSTFDGLNGLPNNKGLMDASLVEIWMNNITVKNFEHGVYKLGGVLSLRCNAFEENHVGVLIDYARLNMSANSGAGYNNFTNNYYNLEALNMLEYQLDKGFNRFEPFFNCNIWTTSLLACEGEDILIPANANIWTVENGIHENGVHPSCISETYPPGTGCAILFQDLSPASNNVCPASKPTVKPPSRKRAEAQSAAELINRFYKNATDETLISTEHFNGVTLDSALTYAANLLEVYDSLGNDAFALELFSEIFSTQPSRDSSYTRQLINWGVVMMKTAVEGMFNQGELMASQEELSFSSALQSYVDVLNWNTDSVLTGDTYRDQFYNELNKGQLFMTLGNPLMAYEIYSNLNTCGLDTLESIQLEFWKNQALAYADVTEQGDSMVWVDGESVESPYITGEYIESSVESDFSFGTIIHSPLSVSFISCGEDPVYRGLWDNELVVDVYPNPAKDHVRIDLDGSEWINQIIVSDALGKVLYQIKIESDKNTSLLLPLDERLPSGTYFISLIGNDLRETKTFVKE